MSAARPALWGGDFAFKRLRGGGRSDPCRICYWEGGRVQGLPCLCAARPVSQGEDIAFKHLLPLLRWGSICYSEHIMCHGTSCSPPRDPIQCLGYGFPELDYLNICPYHVYEVGIPGVASRASIFLDGYIFANLAGVSIVATKASVQSPCSLSSVFSCSPGPDILGLSDFVRSFFYYCKFAAQSAYSHITGSSNSYPNLLAKLRLCGLLSGCPLRDWPTTQILCTHPPGPTPQFCSSGESPLEMRPAGGATSIPPLYRSSRQGSARRHTQPRQLSQCNGAGRNTVSPSSLPLPAQRTSCQIASRPAPLIWFPDAPPSGFVTAEPHAGAGHRLHSLGKKSLLRSSESRVKVLPWRTPCSQRQL
ncbi:hypothetical protein NDU88_004498 [Pleurodeles waltl]|uniref:Uncharacterized protein n=1 Tax=Pleurodeles waltl TaxID=8319 RepID=A0AAV7T7Y5_PLEWA|nr:hypothetical protein NDU88_004498 [Pleurodeles waltl]